MEEDVRTGNISTLLTKPVNYIFFRFFGELGRSVFKALMIGLPIIIAAIFILHLSLPSSPMFFVSVALGFIISSLLSLLIGMWSFFTTGSVWGLRITRDFVEEVMSGSLIPLYIFPEWLKSIAYLLPFQAIYNIPLSIYVGKIASYEILYSIGMQVLWIAILFSVCFFAWKFSERRILIHGG
jgi:ABC-2 type transport system permease protein